jgi:hydroxypyruvate isomerase
MPRLSANVSMLFTERPLLERFAAAAESGFAACEFLFPYAESRGEVAAALKDSGLELALFNLPPGDWDAGERGLAGLPERRREFEESLELALHYAEKLPTPRLHAMAGVLPPGANTQAALETYVDNLRTACDAAAKRDLQILIEPLNLRDMPGYLLPTSEMARQVLREVDRPNLAIQFDVYHAQIMEGDLTRRLEALLPEIGHIQIAGVPERHEPDTGEVDYAHVFRLLDALGYEGWVGCEYRPRGTTEEGLGWREKLLG